MSITLTGTSTAHFDVSPSLTAARLTALLSKAIEQLTLGEFDELWEALQSMPGGDKQSSGISVGDVLAAPIPGMRAPVHKVVLTGTKTVQRDVSPSLTAALLTQLLAKPIEQLTLAEYQQLREALMHLPGGEDRSSSVVIGEMLV